MTPVDDTRFQLSIYAGDGSEIENRYLPRDELRAFDLNQFDHVRAPSLGYFAFRSVDGQWTKRSLSGCGLGEIGWKIVQLLQLECGAMLTAAEIAEGTGIASLRNNPTLAGRLAAIRRAHGENGRLPWLFHSQRNGGYRIGWNPEASWCWVERLSRTAEDGPTDAIEHLEPCP